MALICNIVRTVARNIVRNYYICNIMHPLSWGAQNEKIQKVFMSKLAYSIGARAIFDIIACYIGKHKL